MKKTTLVFLVIGGVLLLTISTYLYLLIKKTPGYDRTNTDIPSRFRYTSPRERIPDAYVVSRNGVGNTSDFSQKGDVFYCTDGNKAEKMDYFSHSEGSHVEGGWYYRYAIVCGDSYWIVDGSDSHGRLIYGPFS